MWMKKQRGRPKLSLLLLMGGCEGMRIYTCTYREFTSHLCLWLLEIAKLITLPSLLRVSYWWLQPAFWLVGRSATEMCCYPICSQNLSKYQFTVNCSSMMHILHNTHAKYLLAKPYNPTFPCYVSYVLLLFLLPLISSDFKSSWRSNSNCKKGEDPWFSGSHLFEHFANLRNTH